MEAHPADHAESGAVLRRVLDGLNRCAAELARLERLHAARPIRTRRVYVCHPFHDDPTRNVERVRDICVALLREGVLPVAPQLYLPQFISEETDRDLALRICLELLGDCDEVRVYGRRITDGMRLELDRARALGIALTFEHEEVP
jgi:hypothetical protein